MHPLLILLVGMATILAGILGLRLNAFLALITAATGQIQRTLIVERLQTAAPKPPQPM